jgi:hypothetical protein
MPEIAEPLVFAPTPVFRKALPVYGSTALVDLGTFFIFVICTQ